MKTFATFLLSACLMTVFMVVGVFAAEMTEVARLDENVFAATIERDGDDLILTWEPLPYPCIYTVETLCKTSGLVDEAPEYHTLAKTETPSNSLKVPRSAIPTYFRISARGLFGKVFAANDQIKNPNFPDPPSPVPVSVYDEKNPASLMPFVVWHTVPTAVCYEVEILSDAPEIEGGISRSKLYSLTATRSVFTNGCQIDLRKYKEYAKLYWRARALGLHHEPIGEFCKAQPIVLDADKEPPSCPLINNFDRMPNFKQPIYPVYNWIPLVAAKNYEVELLNHPPTVENDVEPSPDSLWRQKTVDKMSCYDEYARPYAGPYYWRVRALDEKGKPVGTWSNSEKFVVADYTGGVDVAVFGDSVSHGGGSVSYSPAALEYSYETYLDFSSVNLSRSGDTTQTTLDRFKTDVLPFKPKNLIILTGTNDLRAANVSAESMIASLKKIGDLCRRNKIRPIFLTLMPVNPNGIGYVFNTPTDPNWQKKLRQVNEFIKKQEYHIDVAPYFFDAAGNMSPRMAIDGLHPDIRGKMVIAELINLKRDYFVLGRR